MKNKNTKPATKKGQQGRPKGAFSFENVLFSSLSGKANPDTVIPVSRKWAKQQGITGTVGSAGSLIAAASVQPIVAPTPETAQ